MSVLNLKGKKGVIIGIANDKSLAWGIASALSKQGAELAFSFVNDSIKKRVTPLAKECNSELVFECDVLEDESIKLFFKSLNNFWDKIDFLVHSVAYSDKNELKGSYLDTSRENFLNTLNISCFSFTALAKESGFMMNDGGSLLTLSYLGAERVIPHYNVMGIAKSALETSVKYLANDLGKKNIRVNAISAGPIKTLAASGISDFRYILKWNEFNAPLKRTTTIEEVGKNSIYLLSDLSSGVTGEIIHVDCGYHVVGMKAVDAPDIVKE
ncbi:MAG: enoyl-[acyl-carrier-protein] reductase FabI [Rickettsiales bacterium]|nr:enoyl-[acyl-carrier-protein] reductase FabI [Rickettsiales bacterium]|tara:strand:+ start:55 stop:861 length:807 start_codon:yes stop_codon:yes gene_type:complete